MNELICAMDPAGGIGYKNSLPWHCPEELALFRMKTLHRNVVVGRTTAHSLPYLPNRNIFYLSRHPYPHPSPKHGIHIRSIDDKNMDVIYAGGAEIYRQVLMRPGYIQRIHLSVMKRKYTCDTFFPVDLLCNYTVDIVSHNDEFTHYVMVYNPNSVKYGEQQYLSLLRKIIDTGTDRETRNAVTRSIFCEHLKFDIRDNVFPLLTTKKMFTRGIIEELLFFLRGDTDSKKLESKNVNVWRKNTSRSFLDSLGMKTRREGVMGPCFPAGHKVMTLDHGYMNIENLNTDMLVYTHAGKWRYILETFKREYTDSLHTLYFTGLKKPVTATRYHPFLVWSNGSRKPTIRDPTWRYAQDIVAGDYIAYPNNKEDASIHGYSYFTDEAWYVLGILIRNTFNKNHIHLSDKLAQKVSQYVVLHPEPFIQPFNQSHDSKQTNTLYTYTYSSHACHARFLDEVLGGTLQSRLAHCTLQKISSRALKEFLRGYTDTTFRLLSTHISELDKLYLEQLQYQCANTYMDAYTWIKVKRVSADRHHEPIHVYNIDVDIDHSYTVNNLAVHNCYGYQWRAFNATYDEDRAQPLLTGKEKIDQLANVLHLIQNDPTSRRILMTTYNPEQVKECVLPPCHSIILQFYVHEDTYLDMFCYNRSQDVLLGTPFNIASSALLLRIVAQLTGKTARFMHMSLGDAHLYKEHIESAKEQLTRFPYTFPTLELPRSLKTLDDIMHVDASEFKIRDYQSHPRIQANMVA